jgi:hypothetical protein
MAVYPPCQEELTKFVTVMLDGRKLFAEMEWYPYTKPRLKLLKGHIETNWDLGAQRTVYMHYKDDVIGWRRFLAAYEYSLRTESGIWPELISNYSAYVVWLARLEGEHLAMLGGTSFLR